jgi:hypothetical protein
LRSAILGEVAFFVRASVAVVCIASVGVLAVACADSDDDPIALGKIADAGPDRIKAVPSVSGDSAPPPPVGTIDASCKVTIASHPIEASPHVPIGTPIQYGTNPPSSGPHYPNWAHFLEYDKSIEDGFLVHSMEHGAVLMLYKCEPAECASVAASLRAVRNAVPTDLSCDPSTRVRVILAPRPALDVPIAAAAWGWTYKAECVEPASLLAFIKDHYAQGPEDFCAPGTTF